MPRYSYKCLNGFCNASFDSTARVAERDHAPDCPECGFPFATRVFAPTTNILIPAHFKDVSSASWMLPDDPKTEIGDRASRARIASPAERKSFKPKLLEAIKHL